MSVAENMLEGLKLGLSRATGATSGTDEVTKIIANIENAVSQVQRSVLDKKGVTKSLGQLKASLLNNARIT